MPEARIYIKMDNAAFEEPATELGRILRNLAGRVERGDLPPLKLRDVNGNTVGRSKSTDNRGAGTDDKS